MDALDKVTTRLVTLERREPSVSPLSRQPPSNLAAPPNIPTFPPDVPMNLVGSPQQRVMASEKSCSVDSGEKPLASASEKVPDGSLKAVTESFRRARERIRKKSVQPLDILSRFDLEGKDLGVVSARLAPTYLHHVYLAERQASRYYETMFASKNILSTPLFKEVQRLATTLDDLMLSDGVDCMNSTGVERLCRRLFGIEFALAEVSSKSDLAEASWKMAAELDMTLIEEEGFVPDGVLEEGRKRLERKANLNKSFVLILKLVDKQVDLQIYKKP